MQPQNRTEFNQIEHEIRGFDPLETVAAGYDDAELLEIVENDRKRIDNILETDATLTTQERTELYEMGVNLRLDWLFAEGGGKTLELSQFVERANEARSFIHTAISHSRSRGEDGLQDAWSLQVKNLDVTSLAAQRYSKEAQTVLRGTQAGRDGELLADNLMKRVLGQSLELMGEMKKYADGATRLAQDSRGSLYEVMLMTYARMQSYEQQDFDRVLVRSALSREDRPWIGHPTPKRSFDIVIDSGNTKRLLQAKNHRNHEEYDPQIEKIEDTHFGRTLDDLNKYIADFRILVMNPSDPNTKSHVDQAYNHLDQVFGAQLKTAQTHA